MVYGSLGGLTDLLISPKVVYTSQSDEPHSGASRPGNLGIGRRGGYVVVRIAGASASLDQAEAKFRVAGLLLPPYRSCFLFPFLSFLALCGTGRHEILLTYSM